MSSATPTPSRAVDQACNHFEAAWRSGQRPRLEDALPTVPEQDRTALLRELMCIDVDYRRALGEECRAEDYLARFPELDSAWLAGVLAHEAPPETRAVRYRLVRFHAKGGLGEVHVAFDTELRREVALKRMQAQHHGDPDSYRRFLREAAITGRLEHPGVVPVHGLIHDADGRPCYAMRFIEGESLRDALRRLHAAGPDALPGLTLRQLLTRFVTVCQTVAYAHSRGVIHRDLKPSNIMLGKYGETLVVDWGLAKERADPEDTAEDGRGSPDSGSPLDEGTQTGQSFGTPAYMSPEQASGHTKHVGPAGDIYSLGATLYAVLTGRAPYPETPAGGLVSPIPPGGFAAPRAVKPDVPRALEAICLKAMAPRPEDRYATAMDLAADLERWLADEPVSAYREPWTRRVRRWMKRRRTWMTAIAALIVGAVPLLAALVVLLENERGRTEAERQTATQNAERALGARDRARDAVFSMGHMAQSGILSSKVIRRQNLDAARKTFSAFLREYPEDRGLFSQVGEFHFHYAWVCMETGEWQEAREAYHEALPYYERLLREEPTLRFALRRAICWSDLGLANHMLGRASQAEQAYSRALQLYEEVQGGSELVPFANRAEVQSDFAVFLRDTGRITEATAAFQTALTQWETTLARALEPSRADILRQLTGRVGVVLTLAHLKEYVRAREHLSEFARLVAETPRVDILYNAARAYALLAADSNPDAKSEDCAARAVELLRRALARDFINLDRLQRDPDLHALRGRADFRELVRGLEERHRAGFR